MRDILVRAVNESYEPELAQLSCPVAFLWGADDTTAPPEIARRAAEIAGNTVAVEILEHVGHDAPASAPQELGRMIDLVAATRSDRG
jgi:pimeloyl-ACP methyl ester carboxylesterase